ncbi:MAG: AEC family transporter, partial [Chloroflexi bacterium]|nr:AEC family transporter [Chloroflexota bacterium]
AMSEAVLVSELGVGPTLFVLGVAIASYYGKSDGPGSRKAALRFFWSPIFAALVAGVLCSVVDLPRDNPVMQVAFQGLDVVAQANTFLVTLTLGVLLRVEHFGSYWRLLVTAGVIKLLVQPVLVWLPTLVMNLSPVGSDVLIIQAAMPSATLAVVFCQRYGCDARLASVILVATTVLSSVTVLGLLTLLG